MTAALRPFPLCAAALVMLAAGLVTPQNAPPKAPLTPEQITFFETRVRPVLAESCFSCHGDKRQVADLRLNTEEGVRKGGSMGPVVKPGDPDGSLLIQAIRHSGPLKMPKGKKLPPNQIKDLEDWVRMGAFWPASPSGAKAEKPLWSTLPVAEPQPPAVKNQAWAKTPVDRFILAKLEEKNWAPSPPADKRTLIRRITYSLTGLPPTPEEVEAFLADSSPDAYEKVVDRLLASPQYGERWARIWLDVARYADTKGYVFEEDRNFHHAYTYRRWVISAFNKDLPYDDFILRQIAADRLPEVTEGDELDDVAALGFLTVGRRFLNAQPDIIDDRIDVVTRGFQGLTVSCARCHDHKYDPVPTQDYYSLYGVFASTQDVVVPISAKSIRDPWIAHNAKAASLNDARDALIRKEVAGLRARTDLAEPVKAALQGLREEALPGRDVLAKLLPTFTQQGRDRLAELQKEQAALTRSAPAQPEFALAVSDKPDPSDGVVFRRGNPGNPGEPAPRRFLAALSPDPAARAHWTAGSGRLELAEAIASPDNPLTARVFVNRVWQGHFGEGLVRTPSDFGRQGEPPTHPELLDWLASWFMDNGWSIKKLHRLVVTSAVYRQASGAPSAISSADPENRLWARQNLRRLDLEQMRDSLVMASGRLALAEQGGRSVDLWAPPFTTRRAVYGFVERQNLPGVFRTFDFASPDSTSAKRFQTIVPQQALFFMNSPFAADQARALAARPEVARAAGSEAMVKALYRLLFNRPPNSQEIKLGSGFLGPNPLAPLDGPGRVWEYGTGRVDQGKVADFLAFKETGDLGWTPTKTFPDPEFGYLVLNAHGGHPGKNNSRAIIRRWRAPEDGVFAVEGKLAHGQAAGDGVKAKLVSSREGVKGDWAAHKSEAQTSVIGIALKKGDTLDFVVEPGQNDNSDSFMWSPTVRSQSTGQAWGAAGGFTTEKAVPFTRLAAYSQALLMSNEFLFID